MAWNTRWRSIFTWRAFWSRRNLAYPHTGDLDNTSNTTRARWVDWHTALISASTLSSRVCVLFVVSGYRWHIVYSAMAATRSKSTQAYNQLIPYHHDVIASHGVVNLWKHIWPSRWTNNRFQMARECHRLWWIFSIDRNRSKTVSRPRCLDRAPNSRVWCRDECISYCEHIRSDSAVGRPTWMWCTRWSVGHSNWITFPMTGPTNPWPYNCIRMSHRNNAHSQCRRRRSIFDKPIFWGTEINNVNSKLIKFGGKIINNNIWFCLLRIRASVAGTRWFSFRLLSRPNRCCYCCVRIYTLRQTIHCRSTRQFGISLHSIFVERFAVKSTL